jgi:hypothetical protein
MDGILHHLPVKQTGEAMPLPKIQEKKKDTHVHQFGVWTDPAADRCNCGALLISPMEKIRREAIWQAYYEQVRESRSYKDFIRMKEAFKASNFKLMKEIQEEMRTYADISRDELGQKQVILHNPITEPPFPDPSTWNKYVIAEDDYSKIFQGVIA